MLYFELFPRTLINRAFLPKSIKIRKHCINKEKPVHNGESVKTRRSDERPFRTRVFYHEEKKVQIRDFSVLPHVHHHSQSVGFGDMFGRECLFDRKGFKIVEIFSDLINLFFKKRFINAIRQRSRLCKRRRRVLAAIETIEERAPKEKNLFVQMARKLEIKHQRRVVFGVQNSSSAQRRRSGQETRWESAQRRAQ